MKIFGQKTRSLVILLSTLSVCLLILYLSTQFHVYQEARKKRGFKAILSKVSQQISAESKKALTQVKRLSKSLERIHLDSAENEPKLSSSSFNLTETGILFNDYSSAISSVWAPAIATKSLVLKSLAISKLAESSMKQIVSEPSIFSQSYFNDKYLSSRIVPPIDTLAQFKEDMIITEMNFYFLAAPEHNPSKNALWISEPYVDPAGRGSIISALAPVYCKNEFIGVCGADISIHTIIYKWFQNFKDLNIIILSESGQIVFGNSNAFSLLSLPDPIEHQYTGSIRNFTFIPETYNLLKSPTIDVRKAAIQILKNREKEASFYFENKKTTLLAEKLESPDWTVVAILQ